MGKGTVWGMGVRWSKIQQNLSKQLLGGCWDVEYAVPAVVACDYQIWILLLQPGFTYQSI